MGGFTHELAEVAGGGQLLWKTMNSGVGSTAFLGQFVLFCTGLCLNLLTQSCGFLVTRISLELLQGLGNWQGALQLDLHAGI